MVDIGVNSFAWLLLQSWWSNELVLQLGLNDGALRVVTRLRIWEYVEALDQTQHRELLQPKTLRAAENPAMHDGLIGQIYWLLFIQLPVVQFNISPGLLVETSTSDNSSLGAHACKSDLVVRRSAVIVGAKSSIYEEIVDFSFHLL